MSDLTKNNVISKNISTSDDLDFDFLRKKGIDYLEQLSGKLWTDYNIHDPGVTLLEMLCYAITDLGARINMPIENILAPKNGEPGLETQFFKASQILPSKPVTANDYRRLFIDIEGVKNCWLEPYKKTVYADCKNSRLSYNKNDFKTINSDYKSEFELNGLYSVRVDFDELNDNDFPTKQDKEFEIERIIQEITSRYHANRNLCEDLVEVKKIETQPISVCASIEVTPEADEELVHAKVLLAIDNYFSPSLKFYSLKQMLEKGYSTDRIFEGPTLIHGFIDPVELQKSALKKEVRLSDIIQIIMDIDEVKHIKEISINDCFDPENETDEWLICIENGMKPVRCEKSAFSYFKGVLPVNVNSKKVKTYFDQINKSNQKAQQLTAADLEIGIPAGNYLETGETTTIQNDFPDVYGIGTSGLPSTATDERKAQAKQLKAYLLFFDQLLASYFAHLEKVKDILSVDNQLKNTYFTQLVNDVSGFEELVTGIDLNDETFTRVLFDKLDEKEVRKNQILDHLIARFAERFGDFAFLMSELYGAGANKAILLAKQQFLADYNVTSQERGSAFNYFYQEDKNLWNTSNVSGAQKRIARLAGSKDFNRRDLSKSNVRIYPLVNSEGEHVFRWHIKNNNNRIILSATEDYKHPSQAETELLKAVLKIIGSDSDKILRAFESGLSNDMEVENFRIKISENGKYSFDIIDRSALPGGKDWIIARQFTEHKTLNAFKNAIVRIIDFMTRHFSEEGMFLVEHILLRPDVTQDNVPGQQFMPVCDDVCTDCNPLDPYSFRVTIVLPGWTYRFGNPDFRNFLEDLIRKELPAHILARICWIGERKGDVNDNENQMLQFEKAWKNFLLDKTDREQSQNTELLQKLNQIIAALHTIYPTGKLIDCDDEDDTLEGRIILGRTNIGNL